MWETTALKRRAKRARRLDDEVTASTLPETSRESPADRVRSLLTNLGCAHLRARAQGQHIVIERDGALERSAVARLTAFGCDRFGLAFREKEGAWQPLLIVDTLEAIVAGLTAVLSLPHVDA